MAQSKTVLFFNVQAFIPRVKWTAPPGSKQAGRDSEPSAAIIDSQSIKTSSVRGSERGFDGGKKIYGRKRHLLVDTLGLLLAVKVHSAGLVDRRGAPLLLGGLAGRFPRLRLLFADSGYTGPLIEWIKVHLGWKTEIVPKPDPWVLINGKLTRWSFSAFLWYHFITIYILPDRNTLAF